MTSWQPADPPDGWTPGTRVPATGRSSAYPQAGRPAAYPSAGRPPGHATPSYAPPAYPPYPPPSPPDGPSGYAGTGYQRGGSASGYRGAGRGYPDADPGYRDAETGYEAQTGYLPGVQTGYEAQTGYLPGVQDDRGAGPGHRQAGLDRQTGLDRPAGLDRQAGPGRRGIGPGHPPAEPGGGRFGAGTEARPGVAGRSERSRRASHARRSRRVLVAVLLVVVTAGAGLTAYQQRWIPGLAPASAHGGISGLPTPASSLPDPAVPSATTQASASAAPVAAGAVVVKGKGTFAFGESQGPVLGTGGTLRRYRVAVENGIGQDVTAFAATVDRVLGDPRSWVASGELRLQRVPKGAPFDFTIYLASQATAEAMCAVGGLHTGQYTSCRLTGQVILNLTRWLTAVPDYGAPVEDYRAYAIEHEVGHELGHGHEACPGPGRPAPVMQQQTLGLKGCLANSWPYLNGQLYKGAAIP